MVLLIDNYDSFTYNLYDYIAQLQMPCIVIRNDARTLQEIKKLKFNSIVISPGPERPQSAGITMQIIEEYHRTIPILGICLGHQAIGEYFGAELVKAKLPMHGKTSTIKILRNNNLFRNIPSTFKVMRYHSLVLENLPDCLQPLAITNDNAIMAFQHTALPLLGIQFHPESILTEHGMLLLKNWFEYINQKR